MGRSVARPQDAGTVTAYQLIDEHEEWSDFVEYIRESAMEKYPSLRHQNSWIGRELLLIASNTHASLVVASYCGVVSISLVPEPNRNGERWVRNVSSGFLKAFGALRSLGTASNGEQFFEYV